MEPGLQPKLVAVNVKEMLISDSLVWRRANDAGNFTASIGMVPPG